MPSKQFWDILLSLQGGYVCSLALLPGHLDLEGESGLEVRKKREWTRIFNVERSQRYSN